MLEALRTEAPLALLFLKSVRRIDALEWRDGDPAPRLLFSCEAVPAAPGAVDAAIAAAMARGGTGSNSAAAKGGGGAPAPVGHEAEWRRLAEQRGLFMRAAQAPVSEDVSSTFAVALVTW